MSASFAPKPPRGDDFPCDDGEPMESKQHRIQMNVLVDSLEDAWRDRDDFFVAGNMGVYFSETQVLNNDFRAPDVFVVLDTDKGNRKRWVVWEEGGRTPDVVIEVTSESTEEVDRGKKMTVYARMLHVPFYAIFDPYQAQLDAYRLDADARRYVGIEPDARGYVQCAPLGLWLGVVPGVRSDIEARWLRWIDDEGNVVPERGEREAERGERETERAERETERAARAEARAADAEAELARLRAQLPGHEKP